MSGEYICKAAAVSISAPLSGAAPLSTLSLCRGYCEAFTEPTSVRCQRTFSVEEEEGWWWWGWGGEGGQWTAARARVGFTLAKVTHCSLWLLAPLTQSGWEQNGTITPGHCRVTLAEVWSGLCPCGSKFRRRAIGSAFWSQPWRAQ